MRKLHSKNSRRGFTLAELLIVIAIMGILAAIGFVAVIRYRTTLKLTEMDRTAEELYITAQGHLSASLEDGGLQEYLDAHQNDDSTKAAGTIGTEIASPPSDCPSDVSDEATWKNSNYRYIVYDPSASSLLDSSILKYMLPAGSFDDTVRTDGHYIIEYSAASATVYGVFYTDHKGDGLSYADLSGTAPSPDYRKDRTSRSTYRRGGSGASFVIGYCGGSTVMLPDKIDLKNPHVQVVNGNRLYAIISNPASNTSALKLYVHGRTSGSTMALDITRFNGNEIKPNQNTAYEICENPLNSSLTDTDSAFKTYACVLDDITHQGSHFSELYSGLIPGEDIDVYAVTYSKGSSSLNVSNTFTTNSLFGGVSQKTDLLKEDPSPSDVKQTADIGTIRHLENLDPRISNISSGTVQGAAGRQLEPVVQALQSNDLYWENTASDTAAGGSVPFKGAAVSADPSYDGIFKDFTTGSVYDCCLNTDAENRKESGSSSSSTDTQITEGSYWGICSPKLYAYSGNWNTIHNLSIQNSHAAKNGSSPYNAGLFRLVSHSFGIKDLNLSGITVSAAAGKAGSDTAAVPSGSAAALIAEINTIEDASVSVSGCTIGGNVSVVTAAGDSDTGVVTGTGLLIGRSVSSAGLVLQISDISLAIKTSNGISGSASGGPAVSNTSQPAAATDAAENPGAQSSAGLLIGSLYGSQVSLTAAGINDSDASSASGISSDYLITGRGNAGSLAGYAEILTADLSGITLDHLTALSYKDSSTDGSAIIPANAGGLFGASSLKGTKASYSVTGKVSYAGLSYIRASVNAGSVSGRLDGSGSFIICRDKTLTGTAAYATDNLLTPMTKLEKIMADKNAGGMFGMIAVSDSLTINTDYSIPAVNYIGYNPKATASVNDSAGGYAGSLSGTGTITLNGILHLPSSTIPTDVNNSSITTPVVASSLNAGGIFGSVQPAGSLAFSAAFDMDQPGFSIASASNAGGVIGTVTSSDYLLTVSGTSLLVENAGAITSGKNAGGFIGEADSPVKAAGLTGKLSVSQINPSQRTTNFINTTDNFGVVNMNVSGTENAGGLIGISTKALDISNAVIYAETQQNGSITTQTGSAGGFIGSAGGTSAVVLKDCASTAIVASKSADAGGFIGSVSCPVTLTHCYSAGHTITMSSTVSGTTKNISKYSDSAFNVTAADSAGGFIGSYTGTAGTSSVAGCFSTCSVKGTVVSGGFVGSDTSGRFPYTSCYSAGLVYAPSGSSTVSGNFAGKLTVSALPSIAAADQNKCYSGISVSTLKAVGSSGLSDTQVSGVINTVTSYTADTTGKETHVFNDVLGSSSYIFSAVTSVGLQNSATKQNVYYGDWQEPTASAGEKTLDGIGYAYRETTADGSYLWYIMETKGVQGNYQPVVVKDDIRSTDSTSVYSSNGVYGLIFKQDEKETQWWNEFEKFRNSISPADRPFYNFWDFYNIFSSREVISLTVNNETANYVFYSIDSGSTNYDNSSLVSNSDSKNALYAGDEIVLPSFMVNGNDTGIYYRYNRSFAASFDPVALDETQRSPYNALAAAWNDGSSSVPYYVRTAEQLKNISHYYSSPESGAINHKDLCFRQNCDISLPSDVSLPVIGDEYLSPYPWWPGYVSASVDPFDGTYNALHNTDDCHTIIINNQSRINSYDGNIYYSLFKENKGTISHLNTTGTMSLTRGGNNVYIGGIVSKNAGTLDKCTTDVSMSYTRGWSYDYGCYMGGLVGYNSGFLSTYCRSYARMSLSGYFTSELIVGGVVGDNTVDLKSLVSNASITLNAGQIYSGSPLRIGGLVGRQAGSLSDCSYGNDTDTFTNLNLNFGSIDAGDIYTGGLAGSVSGSLTGCNMYRPFISTATNIESSGSFYAGGVAGYAGDSVTSCNEYNINSLTISGQTAYSTIYYGGITGYSSGAITTCNNKNTINLIPTGQVAYSTIYNGGISGYAAKTISQCYMNNNLRFTLSSGISSSTLYCGGICGLGAADMSNCHFVDSDLAFSGTASYASTNQSRIGGITGKANGNVSDCSVNNSNTSSLHKTSVTFSGSVQSSYSTGGIAGQAASLSGCSNSNVITVSYGDNNGGNSGTVTDIGGVAGISDSTVSNCTNNADVIFNIYGQAVYDQYIGGIAGDSVGNISGCTSSSPLTVNAFGTGSSSEYIGGVAGRAQNGISSTDFSSSIVYNFTNNKVMATVIGGITGQITSGNIQGCNWTGSQIAFSHTNGSNVFSGFGNTWIGGIAGSAGSGVSIAGSENSMLNSTGSINVNISNSVTIPATDNSIRIGGIAGTTGDNCTIQYCMRNGSITYGDSESRQDMSTKMSVGGIIANSGDSVSIKNSTAKGTVTANIASCNKEVSIGRISSVSGTGTNINSCKAIDGDVVLNINNCYYNAPIFLAGMASQPGSGSVITGTSETGKSFDIDGNITLNAATAADRNVYSAIRIGGAVAKFTAGSKMSKLSSRSNITAHIWNLYSTEVIGGLVADTETYKNPASDYYAMQNCNSRGYITIDRDSNNPMSTGNYKDISIITGGIAGSISDGCNMKSNNAVENINCRVSASGAAILYAGGFAGSNTANLTDCHVLSDPDSSTANDKVTSGVSLDASSGWSNTSSTIYLGGLSGYSKDNSYSLCSAESSVALTGSTSMQLLNIGVGGFAGYQEGKNTNIDKCFAASTIKNSFSSDSSYYGGFVGKISCNGTTKQSNFNNSYAAVNFSEYSDTDTARNYTGRCGMFAGNVSNGPSFKNSFAVQTIDINISEDNNYKNNSVNFIYDRDSATCIVDHVYICYKSDGIYMPTLDDNGTHTITIGTGNKATIFYAKTSVQFAGNAEDNTSVCYALNNYSSPATTDWQISSDYLYPELKDNKEKNTASASVNFSKTSYKLGYITIDANYGTSSGPFPIGK